jgi:hypothetical protein
MSGSSFSYSRSLLSALSPELINWDEGLSSSELKIAIIGFGKMGLLHIGILNLLIPGVVKAVVDKSFFTNVWRLENHQINQVL